MVVDSKNKDPKPVTDPAQVMPKTNTRGNTDKVLDLSPEMIDLIEKAGIDLDLSMENLDYRVNIIYRLQKDMNRHSKKYSVKDAKVLNSMMKQLKDEPILTAEEDIKFENISLFYRITSMDFNVLRLDLEPEHLNSEENYDKYKQFCKQRISSTIYKLDINCKHLSFDLYHKGFQLIHELS